MQITFFTLRGVFPLIFLLSQGRTARGLLVCNSTLESLFFLRICNKILVETKKYRGRCFPLSENLSRTVSNVRISR